jgi:transposase
LAVVFSRLAALLKLNITLLAMPLRPCKKPPQPKSIAPKPGLPGLTGVVGIDVSKGKFNACFLLDATSRPQHGAFTSDAAGHVKFLLWLDRVAGTHSVHLCLEETGCYGQALAKLLNDAGHHVSLVNPALIKSYAGSLNVRTKNDRVDAQIIAQYTLERSPKRWTPLPAQHQALRELHRRREQLLAMQLEEKNHLEASPSEMMSAQITQMLAHLQQTITEVEGQMSVVIASDPILQHNAKLLQTIPGIGLRTAQSLLAELPPLDSFEDARALCAYAGLTPREKQSGSSVQGRSSLCKQGRGSLRKLMFMPALSVLGKKTKHSLSGFIERLRANQKVSMCIIGALMRKLMALAFAILRSGKPFDPNYARTQAMAAVAKN